MIEQVEHSQSDFYLVFLTAEGQLNSLSTWTSNESKRRNRSSLRGPTKSRSLVHNRVWKSSVNIKTGITVIFHGAANSPHARNRLGASNDNGPRASAWITACRIISEELVKVVQIARGLRSHV